MISHTHRCIFVHIPKTGGTSIEDVLWPGTRSESDLWMGFVSRFHNKYQTGGLQHLLASQIRTEVGDDIFSSYFKFVVVRNPWDRLVSQYSYLDRRADLRGYFGIEEGVRFSDYVEAIARSDHVQVKPQVDFTHSNGVQLVDFVARFERLDEDFAFVATRLGLAGITLPHVNKSDRDPDYRRYYDVATRRRAGEIFARDIEIFGYSFD